MSYPISQMMNNKPANPHIEMAGSRQGVGDYAADPSFISTDPLNAINDLPVGPSGLPTDLSTLASSYLQNTSVNSIGGLLQQLQQFAEDNPGIALAIGGFIVFLGLGGLNLGGSGRRRR